MLQVKQNGNILSVISAMRVMKLQYLYLPPMCKLDLKGGITLYIIYILISCFDLIGGTISLEAVGITQNTPTMMHNLHCNGNETHLQFCNHAPLGSIPNGGQMLMMTCYPSKYIESFFFGSHIVFLP